MAELQTLAKALDILNILGKSDSNLSVEDISKELDIPESTTYRLLQTLEKKGFIERKSRANIALGYNILNLARNTYEKIDRQLTMAATPIMQELTDTIGETSLLSIRSDLYSTCLKSIACTERIRFVADEKRLLPIHLGASGKAILAFENQSIIDLAIENINDKKISKNLIKELELIKSTGYATSKSEYDIGAFAIGVPIYNSLNQVYASLALVGPQYRFKENTVNEVAPLLKEAAQKIQEQL